MHSRRSLTFFTAAVVIMKKRILADINVVPYVDVMLVLLVIFMITTPILTQSIHVDLPEQEGKTIYTEADLPLILTIDKDSHYYLQNATVSPQTALPLSSVLTEVAAEVKLSQKNNKPKQVLLKGDKGVHYGDVVKVMAKLNQLGVTELGLLTTPKFNEQLKGQA
jgi:biopolymer transport protein TolR